MEVGRWSRLEGVLSESVQWTEGRLIEVLQLALQTVIITRAGSEAAGGRSRRGGL